MAAVWTVKWLAALGKLRLERQKIVREIVVDL